MRTLSELDDALDRELAWRRTELQALLGTIRASRGPAVDCLRRGGIALLYAHWEGYSKQALTNYWRFVAKRRLPYKSLRHNFVALGIEAELNRAQGLTETQRLVDRVVRLLTCDEDRALMTDREVDTQSNLNSDVLQDLLARLGLDGSVFVTRSHLIDYSLLRARNHVAHGEYLSISTDDYVGLHHEVLRLIDSMRTLVSNAAATGEYRRSPPP